jgi:hypothetical protein
LVKNILAIAEGKIIMSPWFSATCSYNFL